MQISAAIAVASELVTSQRLFSILLTSLLKRRDLFIGENLMVKATFLLPFKLENK